MFSIIQVFRKIKSLVSYAQEYIKEGINYRAEERSVTEYAINYQNQENEDPGRAEVSELYDRYQSYRQQCVRGKSAF